ncbi:hypothetical protein [Sciscionella sediminilitoris]|uniref:hypothetical protein n=1 Tax=Sciscionella sediminilitoris TaxID=1445613 RepID=UPI0004DEF1DD|nr:hypothetical protein [Sciscionella sp. SE31]
MRAAADVVDAVAFVWLGMVLAISFLEAPLKFRAPGVTLMLGLGIGRLVFRALHVIELVFAVLVVCALLLGNLSWWVTGALGLAVVLLLAQLVLVQPRLTRRSDAVLAGAEAPRSRAHYAYIALEGVKVLALLFGGVLTLAVQ